MSNVSKIITFIFNVLIGALSAMAIVGYILMPFWTISVGVKFTPETKEAIMKFVDESLKSDNPENSAKTADAAKISPILTSANADGSEGGNNDAEIQRKTIEAIVDNLVKDNAYLSLPIKFGVAEVFSSLTATDTTPVDKAIRSAVKSVMNDEKLNKVISDVSKSSAAAIVDVVIPLMLTDGQSEQIEKEAQYIGLDEDYLKNQTTTLAEALTSGKNTKNGKNERLTKDGFAEDYFVPLLEDIVEKASDPEKSQFAKEGNDAYEKMNGILFNMDDGKKGEYDGTNYFTTVTDENGDEKKVLNNEAKEVVKKYLKEQMLDKIWTDSEEIGLDAQTVCKFLLKSSDKNSSSVGENSGKDAKPKKFVSNTFFAVNASLAAPTSGGESNSATESEKTGENTEDTVAAAADEIADNILSQMDEKTKKILVGVMKGLSWLMVFSIVIWSYQLVKVIVNILVGKPRTRMKLSIWSGWYPFMLLALLPNLVVFALRKGWVPALSAQTASTLNLVSLTFNSNGMLAFIAAMAFIVIWIPYKIFAGMSKT